MRVQFIDHLPIGYALHAARLYVDALEAKLTPILGGAERARRVLARDLSPGRCLSAFCNRRLVGVLGVQGDGRGFWNPTLQSLTEEYGWIGGVFRFGGACILHHETGPDEWCVDGLAVAEEMRGKGIGTGLLRLLEETAAAKGVRKITLEATDTNERARALYERLGFIETARQSLRPFNLIFKFPFQSSILMEKPVSRADPAGG